MDTPRPVAELHYRLDAPVRGHFPGAHRSLRGESGFEFRGHAPLGDAPDARRIDLHASLRDPFGRWIVRVYSQRKAIPVTLLADLSASMGFRGARRKLDVLADFVQGLARSAWRNGDSFGFIGCDGAVRDDLRLPQTRSRGAGETLADALRAFEPEGRSAHGLLAAHRHLGRQRALLFVVSDFHLPLDRLDVLLAGLAPHAVVPVVLWDAAEFGSAARQGLVEMVDPESGRGRLVWWRPQLRDQWHAAHAERRAALLQVFRGARLRPLFIEGGFDAEAVTRHFLA